MLIAWQFSDRSPSKREDTRGLSLIVSPPLQGLWHSKLRYFPEGYASLLSQLGSHDLPPLALC